MLFTADHDEIRRSLQKFIANEINPHVDEWEKAEIFPAHELFRKMGRLGFLGLNKPVEFGGSGLDYSYALMMAEELGAITCGGVPMAIGVQTDMATPALARFGSEEVRREFLAPSISGDYVACIGVSEPGAGSDVASIKTNARSDGDDYVKLAEMQTEVELLRALIYRAGEALVAGEDVTKLATMAKLKAGRLGRELTDACLQYWGGMGFTNETPVSRAYRGSRLTSIGGGADEVMLMVLCKMMGTLPGSTKV